MRKEKIINQRIEKKKEVRSFDMVKNSVILEHLEGPMSALAAIEVRFATYAAYHEEKGTKEAKRKRNDNLHFADKAEDAFKTLRHIAVLCSEHEEGDTNTCQTNEQTSTASSTTQLQVWNYESLREALSPLELSLVNRRMETYYLEQEKKKL